MTKLASMIYGVCRSKGEGIGFSQKHFNPRLGTLVKPMKPSCSTSTKKRLYSYFVPYVDKAMVLN